METLEGIPHHVEGRNVEPLIDRGLKTVKKPLDMEMLVEIVLMTSKHWNLKLEHPQLNIWGVLSGEAKKLSVVC
ncbi:hypothetical protein Sjap_015542 [Stephania japonica]|uniref:Uncharacterized protein n=1 Tax=Stephania japonica TaxID=461633 RepID=A0AAP0IK42_9MAGN